MWAGLHLGWKFWVATFVQWTKNNIQIQTYLTQDFMSLRETTLHAMLNVASAVWIWYTLHVEIKKLIYEFFTWTNKLNLFSTIFFLYLILKSEKKLDLNYIHSHEFLISVIIFFWIWKYIYFYKRNWTMEFLILKWEKGLFFKKPKIKSCLAYNLAAVYQ